MSEPTTPPPVTPPPVTPPVTPPPAALAASWRDTIKDPALRDNPFVVTAPDFDTFVANAVATKAMTGKKAYDLPQADWKPEQWKEWHKTIGVPDAPDKYTPMDKAKLEAAGIPPEVLGTAMAKFHEAGLTDKQARSIVEWYVGDAAKGGELAAQNVAAARVAGEAALKQEYGDKFDAKMGLMKAWIAKNAGEEFAAAVDKAGLGNDPAFVKAIIKSAEATLEADSRFGGGTKTFGSGAEAAIAQADIKEMMSRRTTDAAYNAKFNDPKSAERVQWEKLHLIAYPKPQAA